MAKKLEEIKEEECPCDLPEGWKWERLGNVYQVNPKNNADNEMDAAFIPMAEIEAGFDSGFSYEITTWEKAKKGHTQFADGDVAFAKISPCFENRKSFIAKNLPNGIDAGTTELIILRNYNILSEYTYRFITSETFINDCKNTYSGTVGQQRIDTKFVKNYLIPLPPKETQQKIVDVIESLFAKLDIAQKKVEWVLSESENHRSAILHKAFSGELTEKWREENGVSFGSWRVDKLKDVDIEIIDGDRGKNYPKKEEFFNAGECVFLNAKNVIKKGFSFSEVQFITKEKDDLLRKGKLIRGDIVLTTRGTIGNVALYDDDVPYNNMRINSGMVIYRCGDTLYKPFLIDLYRSKYIIDQINEMQTGSAQPQLPIKIMNELKLCLPTLSEQKEIVRLLDKFLSVEDKVKSTCQSTLETIATMRKSILAKAFRGELCS